MINAGCPIKFYDIIVHVYMYMAQSQYKFWPIYTCIRYFAINTMDIGDLDWFSLSCRGPLVYSLLMKIFQKLVLHTNWNILESDVKHHNPNPMEVTQ